MVAESDFNREDPVDNGGPIDPRDPRARFRQYSTRIEMPELSPLTSLLLLLPRPAFEQQVSRQICDNVDLGMDLVGRPLTQDETDAFVSQAALLIKAPRTGAVLGLWAANLLAFPAFRRFMMTPHLLRQELAHMRMQDFPYWKAGVVSGFGIFTGAAFGSVYSAAGASRNLLTDDRLRGFREDRKQQDPDVIMKRVRDRQLLRRGNVPGQWAGNPAGQMGPTHRPGLQPKTEDEMSPQSGYDGASFDSYSDSDNGSASDSKILRGLYAQQNQQPQRYQEDPSQSGDYGTHDVDFFDSSSNDPDSPAYQGPSGGSSRQYGSSWDRIRAAAQAEGPVKPRRWPQQQQPREDYDLSPPAGSGGQGRDDPGFGRFGGQSKESAQREFDEMLEKERSLGTESDNTASGPKWS
ncbi:hypothetical protein KEM55_008663 [Ascosphaera atra]|nr:hypothetical protein KEM55_008663 [Ascosphaera atra]